jgi:GR25 family glycosyltransferase involved in LPS biosynthesis
MDIHKFFTQCYYTNMSYRPDRNSSAIAEISKLGITPMREEGVIYTGTSNSQWNGWIGCGLCHLNILQKADKNNHVLIFEDDVELVGDYKNVLESALDELPDDWCMLYLGGNAESQIHRVSKHLGKITGLRSTHAYAVNKNYIQIIYDEFYPVRENRIIDTFYQTNIASKYPCFVTIPMTALQRSDKSDIEGKVVEYKSWMVERFNNQLIG